MHVNIKNKSATNLPFNHIPPPSFSLSVVLDFIAQFHNTRAPTSGKAYCVYGVEGEGLYLCYGADPSVCFTTAGCKDVSV